MIFKLKRKEYERVRNLFREVSHQLTVNAVLDGTMEGDVYVDCYERPGSAFMRAPEGDFIVGNTSNSAFNKSLKEVIAFDAYLQFQNEAWESELHNIWCNPYAWKELRYHMILTPESFRYNSWRNDMPSGYTLYKVDRDFLTMPFACLSEVAGRVSEWGNIDKFESIAYGFCLVWKDLIVTRCIADNVHEKQTECGIWTHRDHRGKGLAAITTAAAVEYCIEAGFSEIGWHCLSNNIGSIKTAKKVGFSIVKEYEAYGIGLPAESKKDLTKETWEKYAKIYDQIASESLHPTKGLSYLYAGAAWALAENTEKAIKYLYLMKETGWKDDYKFIKDDWPFWSLHKTQEWKNFVKSL